MTEIKEKQSGSSMKDVQCVHGILGAPYFGTYFFKAAAYTAAHNAE